MSKPSRQQRSRAFTLIELLIVVAIISVLIALMLPSLGRARDQAKAVKCVNNLNAIFKGMFYYMSDPKNGNGYLPQLGRGVDLWPGAYWATQIHPYIKIKRSRAHAKNGLLVCPADPDPVYRWIAGPPGTPLGQEASLLDKIKSDTGRSQGSRRRGSQSAGPRLGPLVEPVSYVGVCETLETRRMPGLSGHHGFVPARWTEVKRPHCYLMLTEATGRTCVRWTHIVEGIRSDPAFRRHHGGPNPATNGSNFLFADGHAQWHSAKFAASDLICCVDFGVPLAANARIPSRYNNIADSIGLQRQHCGSGQSSGRRRR